MLPQTWKDKYVAFIVFSATSAAGGDGLGLFAQIVGNSLTQIT